MASQQPPPPQSNVAAADDQEESHEIVNNTSSPVTAPAPSESLSKKLPFTSTTTGASKKPNVRMVNGRKILSEVLPKAGLVYSEKGNLSEVLCKPKIMPLKSVTLQMIENMEREMAKGANGGAAAAMATAK